MSDSKHPIALYPLELKAMAETLVPRDDTDRHWSLLATTLGRITDEKMYALKEFGEYTSPEAWAKEELDLARGEWRLSMKLWRLLQRAQQGGVKVEEWHALSKGKALLVDEVLAAGGDPRTWFSRAAAAESLEAFEHEVDRHLSRQPFTTFKVRIPVELLPVIKAAMKRVLPEVLGDEAPASANPNSERYWLDLVEDPRYDFRLLEALAVHAMQTLPEPDFEGAGERA